MVSWGSQRFHPSLHSYLRLVPYLAGEAHLDLQLQRISASLQLSIHPNSSILGHLSKMLVIIPQLLNWPALLRILWAFLITSFPNRLFWFDDQFLLIWQDTSQNILLLQERLETSDFQPIDSGTHRLCYCWRCRCLRSQKRVSRDSCISSLFFIAHPNHHYPCFGSPQVAI